VQETRDDLSQYLNPLPDRPHVIELLIKQILSLITQASLEPGDRLPSEKEIIVATGASRPSVREALRALKTMGIVETRPGAGSFLCQLETAGLIRPEVLSLILMGEGLSDVLETRKVLECHIARLASHCGHEELAPLEAVLDKMRSQVDSGHTMYETTWAFHMTLADIAGNPVMAKLVRILYEMVHEAQLPVYWPNVDAQEELEGHERLYQAILGGETEAESEMREHIDRVRSVIDQAIAQGAGLGNPSTSSARAR